MEGTEIPKPGRELDQGSFNAFLRALDPDKERAGIEYERLRRRLILYFNLYRTGRAEELADEAFNRLARKISEGESIREVSSYLIGIARMLRHEEQRRLARQEKQAAEMALLQSEPSEKARFLEALEACLEKLSRASAALIERYYSTESRARIDTRRKMAEEMGISLNALRNRALRLRQELENCVKRQLGFAKPSDIRPIDDSNIEGKEK